MVYLYIISVLLLAGIEGRPLVRNQKWLELAAFAGLVLLGLVIIVMDAVSYKPFRISTVIDYVFRPYSHLIRNLLLRF